MTASSSKKAKIKRGSYKKLSPQQIRSIINATSNLENLALRMGVSVSFVKRIRRETKQSKMLPAQVSSLKMYCFNETIRQLRSQKRKGKCNFIKLPTVMKNYKDSVKANKKFEKLKKEKIPGKTWFKQQLSKYKETHGPNKYIKDMLPNTDITEQQDRGRRRYTG